MTNIQINGDAISVSLHPSTPNYAADISGNVYRRKAVFTGVARGAETAYGDWEIAHLFPVHSKYTPPYLRFSFTVNKKRTLKTAHRFILECFQGIKDRKTVARHRDDNFTDNRLENLVYGTVQDNVDDAFINNGNYAEGARNGRAKLKEDDVLAIRARVAGGERAQDIAKDYSGLTILSIKNAAFGVTWSHI